MSADRDLPLVEELFPVPEPLVCCERLADRPYLVFLDSARDRRGLGRHSFLSADPAFLLRAKREVTELVDVATGRVERQPGHVLDAVRARLAPFALEPVAGVPAFQGGAAGYVGYDFGARLERVPPAGLDDLAMPDAMLGIYDWVLAWDHEEGRAWIVSTGLPARGAARSIRAAERLRDVRGAIARLPRPGVRPRRVPAMTTRVAEPAPAYAVDGALHRSFGLRSTFTRDGYLDAIGRVREYIVAGEIFHANLSQRFDAPLRVRPWELYRRLRALNPAPFAAYLDFGDVVVASASPERFLRADGAAGRVETHTIDGTRPRGAGPEHDAALSRGLVESDRARADGVMVVDLLRNDLSRVCEPGTVCVTDHSRVERNATAQHHVSTVHGRLEAGRDAVDLLCAAFPGGSITGAPKVRAMQIIAELEPTQRGAYCGAIGYVSLSGALDTSMVIRTCVVPRATAREPRAYFAAGGGIVADSAPAAEYAETLDKARALIAALAP